MIRVSHSTALTSLGAATSSSAVVREYLCLFTHDLRRKQKRWEDGRLKYHTFNKRVMVYDERGNFVGDMHWQSGWDFDVGEEVQLERGGVIVQVSDCVGQEIQDLSELLDKRVHKREERLLEKEQRRMASSGVGIPNHALTSSGSEARLQQQTPRLPRIRHRPLTALLPTPTGHHARALAPLESPYEQKKQAAEATSVSPSGSDGPAKRRRLQDAPSSKMGYAQSLFGATLSLSGTPASSLRCASQTMSRHTVPAVAESEASIARQRRTAEVEPDNNRNQREGHDPGYQPSADRSVPVAVAISPPRARPGPSEQATAARVASKRSSPFPISHFDSTSSRLKPQKSQPVPEEVVDLTASSADWYLEDRGVTSQEGSHLTVKTSHGEIVETTGRIGKVTKTHGSSRNVFPVLTTPEEPTGTLKCPVKEPTSRSIPERIGSRQGIRRTELQLKSKKKRGLLMLAEHVDVEPKAALRKFQLHVETAPGFAVGEEAEARPLEDDMFFGIDSEPSLGMDCLSVALADTSDTNRTSREPAQYHLDANPDPPLAGPSGQDEGDDEPVRRLRRKTRDFIATLDTQDELEVSPEEPSAEGHPTRKVRSKQSPSETSDNYAPDEEQQADVQDQPDEPRARRGRSARALTPLKRPATVSEDDAPSERQLVDGGPVVGERGHKPRSKTKRLTSRTTMRKQRLVTGGEEAQPGSTDPAGATPAPGPVAPRLIKLGRRSVRSKEVIGFVAEGAAVPTGSQYRGLSASALRSAQAMANDDNPRQESEMDDGHLAANELVPEPETTTTKATRTPSSQTTPGKGKPGHVGSRVQVQALLVSDACVGHKPAAPGARGPEQVAVEEVSNVKERTDSVPHVSEDATTRKQSESEHQQGLAIKVDAGLPAGEWVETKHSLGCDTNLVRLGGCVREQNTAIPFPGSNEAATVARRTPRIANPATRGRKAALKSHAAGQPPLPALPLDLMGGGVQQAQPRVTASEADSRGDDAPLKRKMTYPGFVSAKEGGPWSREAHDLLDYVRPS